MSWLQNLRKDPKKVKALICATIITIVAAILCAIQPLYSGDIDNYGMALVANKRFAGAGQDGYIQFLHPFLCKMFEAVHWIFPMADSFSLVAEITLLAGVWWISYYLFLKTKSRLQLVFGYLVLFSFILIEDLFHDNFTRWAVFLCMVGMLTLLLNRECKKRYIVIGTIFLSLGMMWRWNVLVIYIPFLLLMFAVEFIQKKGTEKKQFLAVVVKNMILPIICVSVLMLSKTLVDNSEKYKDATAYNNARSAVLDYPLPAWEDVQNGFSGVTNNDYSAVQYWFLLDTDFIDTEFLENMHNVASRPIFSLSLYDMKVMLKVVKDEILGSQHLLYLCTLLGMLFLIFFFSMNWYYKIESVLMFLGMDFILLCLVYAGRGIVRSFYPVIYTTIICVVALLLQKEWKIKKKTEIAVNIIGITIALTGIGYGVIHMNIETSQSVWSACDDEIVNMETIEDEDTTYIWNCGAWTKSFVRGAYMSKGKLITENVMQQNIQEGNWFFGQVYFKQYLDEIGVNNPIDVIFQKDAVYVGENCSFLLYYLQEHVDTRIRAEQTDELLGVPVWNFYVENENDD